MGSGKAWATGIGIAIAVLALGGWIYYAQQRELHEDRIEGVLPPAPPRVAPRHYPVAQPAQTASTAKPLPALGDDRAILASLEQLSGGAGLRDLLRPTQLITHIVATINALPGRSLPDAIVPLHRPQGTFQTTTQDGVVSIAYGNAQRYAPYMMVLDAIPSRALVHWYQRHYPLFQQAYVQLGYPHGYFNDRLIVVIDDLLATPDRATAPRLIRSEHGTWDYAEPALQELSIGQRILLRMGAADEATVKAKLRAIRAQLTRGGPPPTPPTSSGA